MEVHMGETPGLEGKKHRGGRASGIYQLAFAGDNSGLMRRAKTKSEGGIFRVSRPHREKGIKWKTGSGARGVKKGSWGENRKGSPNSWLCKATPWKNRLG